MYVVQDCKIRWGSFLHNVALSISLLKAGLGTLPTVWNILNEKNKILIILHTDTVQCKFCSYTKHLSVKGWHSVDAGKVILLILERCSSARTAMLSITIKIWTHDYAKNVFLFPFILYSGWGAASWHKSAVNFWSQPWTQTPPIWQSWISVTTRCGILEWNCFVIFWRVHTVDSRLWGQTTSFCLYSVSCSIQYVQDTISCLFRSLERLWDQSRQ